MAPAPERDVGAIFFVSIHIRETSPQVPDAQKSGRPQRRPRLKPHQQQAFLSLLDVLAEHADGIERTAHGAGRRPSVPLPEPERKALDHGLAVLRNALQEFRRSLVPRGSDQPASLTVTRLIIRSRTEEMLDFLADAEVQRFQRRYGSLDPGDRETIARHLQQVTEAVTALRLAVEAHCEVDPS